MRQSHRTLTVVACLLVLALLPVLYVLSIGPAIWVTQHCPLPEAVGECLEAFYYPLSQVIDFEDPDSTAAQLFGAYFSLWYDENLPEP